MPSEFSGDYGDSRKAGLLVNWESTARDSHSKSIITWPSAWCGRDSSSNHTKFYPWWAWTKFTVR